METAATLRPGSVSFFDKLRVLIAAAVAVVLVGYVGWTAARPPDPNLAVTFTASGKNLFTMWPTLLVLTLVAAAVGSAVAGPRLPEAGLLAAAVGLVALDLHGGSMQTLLVYVADNSTADRRHLMFLMIVDTLLWAALLAASWIVVNVVWRWIWGNHAAPAPSGTPGAQRKSPTLVDRLGGGSLALIVTTVVAMLAIWMTVSRTPVANIARGQVVASVFFGLYLGAMAGRYFTGVDHARYYLAAPPAVAVIGYLLGHLQANMSWARGPLAAYALLATTPPHALARPLPIEYVAVGLAGAIIGFWSGEKIEHAAKEHT